MKPIESLDFYKNDSSNNVHFIPRQPSLPDLAYVKINGEKLLTFLFVHGYMNSKDIAKAVRLQHYVQQKRYGFVRFDLTDHGQSVFACSDETDGRRNKLLDFDQWRADLRLVIEQVLTGHQLILVGDSMGAWLALLYMHDHPSDYVKGFVGISTAVDVFGHFHKEFFSDTQLERMQKGETVWMQGPYGHYAGSQRLVCTSAAHHLLDKCEINVNCPCYFVHRLSDIVAVPETILRLVRILRTSKVQVTFQKGGDHRMASEEDFLSICRAVDCILLAIHSCEV